MGAIPLSFRGRGAGVDNRRFLCSNTSPPQRTNNPYAQFDDKSYEMGEVGSTTNLTAGLSGGAQEPMSAFYDEVIDRFSLPISFTRNHGPPLPPLHQPEQSAHTDLRLSQTP
jgi:hypothetical protein